MVQRKHDAPTKGVPNKEVVFPLKGNKPTATVQGGILFTPACCAEQRGVHRQLVYVDLREGADCTSALPMLK